MNKERLAEIRAREARWIEGLDTETALGVLDHARRDLIDLLAHVEELEAELASLLESHNDLAIKLLKLRSQIGRERDEMSAM